ncbi:MAG: T9SS type A sorting domain-containing protein [Saprospiraceae bacterium]|nr:T9SS type A sorting domain-containing protein [Saprospiraceae bacterium]
MKRFLLLSMLCCAYGLMAQPIYISHPEIGQRLISRILDEDYITPIDMESVGTDLNWNITPSDIIIQTPDTAWVVSLDNMPKKEFYPAGTLAIRYGSDSSAYFEVFRHSSARLELLGESNYFDEAPTVLNSPLTQVEYPLMYGDSFGDTCTYHFKIEEDLFRGEIEIFCRAEAWGRMKTTNGTYDCIKLAYRSTIQFYVNNVPEGSVTLHEFRFLSPGYSAPVVVYSASELEFGGDITNDTTAYYLTAPPIAATNETAGIEIGISPNPVTDLLYISIPEELTMGSTMAIISPEGKKMVEKQMTQAHQTFTVQNWPSGVYLVQIVSKEKRWGMKSFVLK